jgi:hypothetical protein
MTRQHHRNDGRKALYLRDLVALGGLYLPELYQVQLVGTYPTSPPRENQWRTLKLRPEVIAVLDVLAQRHEAARGHTITKSEIIAAALKLALPQMVTRMFPEGAPRV